MNKCNHQWETSLDLEFVAPSGLLPKTHNALQKRKCALCKSVQRRYVVLNDVLLLGGVWHDSYMDKEDLEPEIQRHVEMLRETLNWMEEQMQKNHPLHIYSLNEYFDDCSEEDIE